MENRKTAYIHLGVPKTGTSAIQIALGRLFIDKRLDKFDMQFHSSDTWSCIFDFWCTRDKKHFIEQVHKNIQKYSRLGEKDVIFSNELIATVLHSNNWGFKYDLLPVLAEAFKDYNIKAIVYIRRQDDFIESMIAQQAKEGMDTEYNNECFSYKTLIDRCLECFRGGGVIVRKFERDKLYKNDVVADFMHIVGLDELIGDYVKDKRKVVNSSLSPLSLRIAVADNKQYQLSESETQLKIRGVEKQYEDGLISRSTYAYLACCYLSGYDNSRYSEESIKIRTMLLTENSNFSVSASNDRFLSAKERAQIVQKYSEDNAAVAREFFGDEDGVLFEDKISKGITDIDNGLTITNELTATDVVQALMPIIINLSRRCDKFEDTALKRFRRDSILKLRRFSTLYAYIHRAYHLIIRQK